MIVSPKRKTLFPALNSLSRSRENFSEIEDTIKMKKTPRKYSKSPRSGTSLQQDEISTGIVVQSSGSPLGKRKRDQAFETSIDRSKKKAQKSRKSDHATDQEESISSFCAETTQILTKIDQSKESLTLQTDRAFLYVLPSPVGVSVTEKASNSYPKAEAPPLTSPDNRPQPQHPLSQFLSNSASMASRSLRNLKEVINSFGSSSQVNPDDPLSHYDLVYSPSKISGLELSTPRESDSMIRRRKRSASTAVSSVAGLPTTVIHGPIVHDGDCSLGLNFCVPEMGDKSREPATPQSAASLALLLVHKSDLKVLTGLLDTVGLSTSVSSAAFNGHRMGMAQTLPKSPERQKNKTKFFPRSNRKTSNPDGRTVGKECDYAGELAVALVTLFQPAPPLGLLPLLRCAFRVQMSDVSAKNDPSTLFRESCITTKMMAMVLHSSDCLEFLQIAVGDPLRIILNSLVENPLELDPNRLSPPVESSTPLLQSDELEERLSSSVIIQRSLSQNHRNFEAAIDSILRSLEHHLGRCPLLVRTSLAELFSETEGVFPDHGLQLVGGFFFLRMVCPAIVSLSSFAIRSAPAFSAEQQRAAILLSKVLQNLSNQVEFGEKETYMKQMNEYLQLRMPDMRSFLNKLVTIPEESVGKLAAQITRDAVKLKSSPNYFRAASWLQDRISIHRHAIERLLKYPHEKSELDEAIQLFCAGNARQAMKSVLQEVDRLNRKPAPSRSSHSFVC